ncbi:MAG: helix-turn-helix domain-containing protein [Saprospiraceae bacterium]|nr:helix-turn-helix domain-containing protein [Saprospiraceae bacterium]
MHQLFNIIEVTQSAIEYRLAHPEPPCRHDYEEIMVGTNGQMDHCIDFRMERSIAPSVVFIPMGKIHYTLPSKDARGWIIQYKSEFAPGTPFSTFSKFLDTACYPFPADETIDRLTSLCQLMNREFQMPSPDYLVIRHLLCALIAMIDSERKKNLPAAQEPKSTQITLFNNFLKILESNFRTAEGCKSYAEKLNISVRHLNNVCHAMFGKSVSEIIETRKLLEARQLLLGTSKTVSEIGFDLGYNEKSYFTRVFHKKIGFTPTEFRSAAKNLSS